MHYKRFPFALCACIGKIFTSFAGRDMKSIYFLLVLIMAQPALANIPSLDEEFSCLTDKAASTLISDFNINEISFGGRELCDNRKDTKKLFNDLMIVRDGLFDGEKDNHLIRGFLPKNSYYQWMKEQTLGMERGNDVPYATAYNQNGYFTIQDGWAKLSTLGRVGTIVHEARHTEDYGHVTCSFGPYAGSSIQGCDRDYDGGGSHAIEMEYYARVSEIGSNFHPVYQTMARLMAVARANFVFNKSPLAKKSALLLIDDKQNALLYYQRSLLGRSVGTKTVQLLKRTSFGAAIFDGTTISALDLYHPSVDNRAILDDYSYYKLLRDDRSQTPITEMRDLEEVDLGRKRYFVYLNKLGKMASYVFSQGQWGRLMTSPEPTVPGLFQTVLADGREGLFLQKNETIYQLNPENMAATKLPTTWPVEYSTFAKVDNQLYVLSKKGQVLVSNGQGFTPAPGLADQQSTKMISVPLYDSFEVQ
jgi:hypothetical protein